MATRVYFENHSASRTTSTSTDFSAEKVALTFTGNANKKYCIFWRVLADYSNNSNLFYIRFRNKTAGADLATYQTIVAVATNEKISVGGFAIFDAGSSPASTEFAIQGKSDNAARTLGMSEASIFALELTDDDQSVSSTAQQTATSSTWQTKATLSWTPGSAGDYLILASSKHYNTSGSQQPSVRIYNGTTGYREHLFYWWNSTYQETATNGLKATGLSGAQSWSLQHNATGSTCGCADTYMVALRLDGFDGYLYDEDLTERSVNSTSYSASQTSITATPAAVDHFVLAFGWCRGSNETATSVNRINVGGAALGSAWAARVASGDYVPWSQQALREEAASSTTWLVEYARGVGSSTIYSDDSALVILQLESSVTSVTVTGSFDAAVQKAIAATLSAGVAVQTGVSLTASADSAVMKALSVAASAEAAVQKAIAASAGADVAAQTTLAVSAALDAAAMALRTVEGALDAVVSKAIAAGFGADAAVQQAFVAAASLDAAVQTLLTAAASADVYVVQNATSVAAVLDAAVSAAMQAAAVLDTAVQALLSLAAAADVAVALAEARTVALDVAAGAGRAATAGFDVLVHLAGIWRPADADPLATAAWADLADPAGGTWSDILPPAGGAWTEEVEE